MFEALVPMDEFFASIYAEQVVDTLKSAGFEIIDNSIKLNAATEFMRLKNFCNTDAIPQRLYYLLYEMILGSFLKSTYAIGKLPDSFNFEAIAGRITLGDTSVELGQSSTANDPSEAKLLMWIDSLKNSWKEEAITCRKIQW